MIKLYTLNHYRKKSNFYLKSYWKIRNYEYNDKKKWLLKPKLNTDGKHD